ncbi:hypothetical protein [Sinomonas gamaensis]|uniref:hypothetical protein n=1 Tax=Sinomonas gamaensis TaxID=2565624 RepID=UPI0011090B62|nr:hypothetical protein [Sinomonas gamaensis]
MGHFLVPSRPTGGYGKSTQVFLPGKGTFDVPISALSAGVQGEVQGWNIAGIGPTERPLLAVLMDLRVPASGLDPEKKIAVLETYDPVSGKVGDSHQIAEAKSDESLPFEIHGSNDNVVATVVESGGQTSTVGFDARSGSQMWTSPGSIYQRDEAPPSGFVVIMDSHEKPSPYCHKTSIVNVSDGTPLKGYTQGPGAYGFCTIHPSVTFPDPKHAIYREQVNSDTYNDSCVTIPNGLACAMGSLTKGDLAGEEGFQGADTNYNATKIFSVIDASTGAQKWSLPPERANALRATFKALNGKYLYIETTDQKLVVDVSGNTTTPNPTGHYPIASLDGWTVWEDGLVAQQGGAAIRDADLSTATSSSSSRGFVSASPSASL